MPVTDPLVASTLQQLSELLGEAVTTQGIETALADVSNLGVADTQAAEWISVQDVRIVDDVVVSRSGRPSSVAIRALEATGRAMSAHELAVWLPAAGGLAATVTMLRRSPTFVETASDQWELTDWGGQPLVQPVSVEVPVTAAVMAGDTREAPAALASLLALVPGTERKLSTRFGPFVVSYDGFIVMRGSVRPVVLASGATIGDVLVFDVDPKQPSVSVTVLAGPTSRLFDPVQPDPTPRSLP